MLTKRGNGKAHKLSVKMSIYIQFVIENLKLIFFNPITQ